MSMRKRTRIAAFAGREIAAKRGLVSSRSMVNLTGDNGRNACSASASTTSISFFTRLVSMVVEGRPPMRSTEQHVDDRIDQVGIDGGEAKVLPLLRLEHADHGGQRDRVHVVAEAHRGDAVERD